MSPGSEGVPMHGDRSAFDNIGFPDEHAKDVANGTPIQHNPTDAETGDAPVWDGEKWVAKDVVLQLEFDGHIHDDRYYRKTELSTSGSATVHWDNITGSPATFSPSEHDHNSLYYAKTELQTSGCSTINWENITGSPTAFPALPHVHVENDITNLSHDAVSILGNPISIDVSFPGDGNVLIWSATSGSWVSGYVSGGSSGGGGHIIEDETTPLTQRSRLSFQGTGVEVTDDAINDRTVVTISNSGSGGGESLTIREIDGSPSVSGVKTIVVTNGTLTDSGSGIATLAFGSAGTDGDAIHDNVDGEIQAIAEKTSLDDNDIFLLEDSGASYAKKRVTLANLRTAIGVGAAFLVASGLPGGFAELTITLVETAIAA